MVNLTIDNTPVSCAEGTTIMNAAASAGISIPHLCYLKDINEIAACRMCTVEVEGTERLVPACDNVVQPGMVVHTNSPRVREARRINAELIMSQHNGSCISCVRSGNCSLQTLCNDLNILDGNPFKPDIPVKRWDMKAPLIHDASKCIKCLRCVNVCSKIQDMQIWDLEGSGGHAHIDVTLGRNIMNSDCTFCGQCVINCSTGALRERDDTDEVFDALADPSKIVIAQVAPSARTSWNEDFGLSNSEAGAGRLVSALKKLGFDYVFDTNTGADLTIMEEAAEFLERMQNPDKYTKPMFTSCCPAWVRFMKSQYPDMVPQLSTTKSPHQILASAVKAWFRDVEGVDPHNIFMVSIMPCLAKKAECAEPNQNDACGDPDVDISLTVREMNRMLRSDQINPALLPVSEFDGPFGIASGAGKIFGVTGGVMEAALRTAYYDATGRNPDPDAFRNVRGMEGWKEAEIDFSGAKIKVAVVSGLLNTRNLIEALRAGRVHYDFVEVMACPGGCSGGGGMPIHDGWSMTDSRGSELYKLDKDSEIRFSHESPVMKRLYGEYIGAPLSEKAEELLHTDHEGWEMPLNPRLTR
ncbi:MAG: [FeFe] hydrogenase, group A [Anaerovoracaceae bacterium]